GQGDAVRYREGGYDAEQPQKSASHQQQPHDEQNMIRAGKDMIDPCRNELFYHRHPVLARASAVGEDLIFLSKDPLLYQAVILVDVQECLVFRLIWKQCAMNFQSARLFSVVEF